MKRLLMVMSVCSIVLGLSGCVLTIDPPPCADPAPLSGELADATRFIVGLKEGSNTAQEATRLANMIQAPVVMQFELIQAFVIDSTPNAVQQLRCDSAVEYVEVDGIVTIQ
ncbi:hypothetical protein VST7929_02331 [Vibrio stylophorae]|uniref:Lipoprotein n=1 Tax=Vibrio stylophorae TaxID=659351 RepID=A0ABN8DX36_9VIBR|nr:hypothetical protein [Vibrio stylophorae]CAH0534400.1 hypothetical protein VST7929_02331 [Vibrio stylophorae]